MEDSKAGRPRKEVEDCTFNGWQLLDEIIPYTTEEHCARRLNMSVSSLQRRIREKHGCNFDQYKAQKTEDVIKIPLRQTQINMVLEDKNVPMAIWLGKQMLGQSDKQDQNISQEINVTIDSEDAHV